ncbi:MAG: GIY-YIG nuclease family protein [Desulfuromonadaceae bacterium]|nr:GIY-YIG nuclease family protein [Desulfuromonadaceae bacterium]
MKSVGSKDLTSDIQRWFLYLLRNERGALYTGITTDLSRRLGEHRSRSGRGGKFTRSCKSLELVYDCTLGSHSLALKAELRVKRLPKVRKELLVNRRPDRRDLLEMLDLTAELVE